MVQWYSRYFISLVSLPRLVDFDWKVNIKSSSDSVSRMAAPTCLVQMNVRPRPYTYTPPDKRYWRQVQSNPESTKEMANVRSINVEFNKETLETMLDGLGKIRDQLSSVAKSSTWYILGSLINTCQLIVIIVFFWIGNFNCVVLHNALITGGTKI